MRQQKESWELNMIIANEVMSAEENKAQDNNNNHRWWSYIESFDCYTKDEEGRDRERERFLRKNPKKCNLTKERKQRKLCSWRLAETSWKLTSKTRSMHRVTPLSPPPPPPPMTRGWTLGPQTRGGTLGRVNTTCEPPSSSSSNGGHALLVALPRVSFQQNHQY